MPVEISFGSREAARRIRNDPEYRGLLAESDDARQQTVRLRENAPEAAVAEITGEAAESKSHYADKAGQAELTRQEREKIDFSREGVNVPKVRSIKGIAANVGVTDYLQFADLDLTVDENREVLERAAREEGNRRDMGRDQSGNAMVDQRLARANTERKKREGERAKEYALVDRDREAQSFVRGREEFDLSISRTDGKLVGQGRDFDRLEKRHNRRSRRARTLDEKKSAEITLDPIKWTNNPDRYDYPGIDTVQPEELHESRSERARRVDEQEVAPIADSKEQWAMHPDRYDWPGVDRPAGPGPTPKRSVPSVERNTDAPEPYTAALSQQDVSLAPEEAFEGVAAESRQSRPRASFGMAADREAESAFIRAEEERGSPNSSIFH